MTGLHPNIITLSGDDARFKLFMQTHENCTCLQEHIAKRAVFSFFLSQTMYLATITTWSTKPALGRSWESKIMDQQQCLCSTVRVEQQPNSIRVEKMSDKKTLWKHSIEKKGETEPRTCCDIM